MGTFLNHALEYHRNGFSVIPLVNKKALVKWEPYKRKAPNEQELKVLFNRGGVDGIGLILGQVSGGLYARDFDATGAYEAWRGQNGHLAETLPTCRTRRGFHVYGRSAIPVKTRELQDGELRGEGAYVAVPPSKHPEGGVYSWVIPLAPPVLLITPEEASFTQKDLPSQKTIPGEASFTQIHRDLDTQETQEIPTEGLRVRTLQEAVEIATPKTIHQNHHRLFVLARALLSLANFRGKPLDDAEYEQAFKEWYVKAKSVLREGQNRDEYLLEFMSMVTYAKSPYGVGVIKDAFLRASKNPPPACALKFDDSRIRLLISLCRELQRAQGEQPFFLSCRIAGKVIGISHVAAATWLKGLVGKKILSIVEPGTTKERDATSYRFVGE